MDPRHAPDRDAPACDARIAAALRSTLDAQRAAHAADPAPAYHARLADLHALRRFIRDNREALVEAIDRDYGHRSRHETLLGDITPALGSIDYCAGRLKRWMRTRRRGIDVLLYPGARNRVKPQPLGVVGIIVPWNFPVFLVFSALATAFAAGNRAMVKLSENSRHLASLLLERLPRYFPPEKLSVWDESGGVGIEFSRLGFDHLLFTGSTRTGRQVMAAAAANLCPVTLELGGKSPALVCRDFPLRTAAERILFAKLLNAGQVCTTVDYLLLPEDRVAEFVHLARQIVPARYASLDSPDYTSLIDTRAFDRIVAALESARAAGATLVPLLPGEPWQRETRRIAPHLVLDAPGECELLQQEIFGPILPVVGYVTIGEAVAFIRARPHPLAFYPFSRDRHAIATLIDQVMSGGVCVNDALWQVAQHDLPFGGVGASGMGQCHAEEGFLALSKLRPIFHQAPLSPMRWLWPPFGRFADRVLDFLSR